MGSSLVLLGIILIAIVIAVTLLSNKKSKKANDTALTETEDNNLSFLKHVTFSQKDIVTDTEKNFFYALAQAVPGHYIFPQVATHAILKSYSKNNSYRQKAFNKYSSTIIDFVICDQNFKVIAVVELDDRTHKEKQAKDATRDFMLNQAGYKTVRFNCENYTVDFIRNEILN